MTIAPSIPPARFDDDAAALAIGFTDRLLSDAEFDRLERLLAESEPARRTFVELLAQSHALREAERTAGPVDTRQGPTPQAAPAARSLPRPVYALAAALLLAATAVAIYLASVDPRSEARAPQSTTASVLDVSDAATLMIDETIASPGERYAGRSVSLDAGEAEFMLPNDVSVRLRGKTAMTIHDPMNVTMAHGSAEFDCPPGAKGYTVHLPGGAKVVDLGTRFRVLALSGEAARVMITEGHVEVHRPCAVSIALAADQTLRIGDLHPWTVLALSADAAHSSPSGFGGSVAATLTDAFDYDPIRPASALPPIGSHDTVNWYVGSGPPGGVLHLSYTLAPTTLVPGQSLAIDLYGRDLSTAVDRDDDFDVELYHGGYSADHRVATAASLAIPDTAPHHLRIDSGDFDADLTGRTFDRIRIVARDSNGPRDPNLFTLVELRAVTLPTPATPDTPDLTPPSEPADRSAATPAVDGPQREQNPTPTTGDDK